MGEPVEEAQDSLGFQELAELREDLHGILKDADRSLQTYHAPGTGGFAHRVDPMEPAKPSDWSKSSTATCIAFLRATGRLDDEPWGPERATLISKIVGSDWESADLGRDNPFTVAFLLEALHDLGGNDALEPNDRKIVRGKLDTLARAIQERGGIGLQKFEPTAFLTFKAVSALSKWNRLSAIRQEVQDWNWNHLYKESVLVASGTVDADVFEVAYSVLIASVVVQLDRMTPQQRNLLRYAVSQLFAAQRPDGAWPRSRPLFVYPKLGHAYCFEYELLTAMLSDPQLRPLMSERLPELQRSAAGLEERKYPLKGPGSGDPAPYGWSSGHHGTDAWAESWSTASVLHFCFVLDRLVAEAIRREMFRYADASYSPPKARAGGKPFLPETFLDAEVKKRSLKRIFTQRFIEPLVNSRGRLDQGQKLPERIVTSAILYGPPGTSKTELAKYLARALGWPLPALDPSHLTRRGLEQVHAEANRLFGMLERCEQIVVLLDEFDELFREREGAAGELESRFLTTAMLPKLAALSAERRIVYLVATNHLEQFDAAIRRPGRFGLIMPVMPPTAKAKLRCWPIFDQVMDVLRSDLPDAEQPTRAALSDLTYLEARELANQLGELLGAAGARPSAETLRDVIAEAADRCTMRQQVAPAVPADGNATWKDQIAGQADRIRGLGF